MTESAIPALREPEPQKAESKTAEPATPEMRVGQSFDIHRYSDDAERTLVLDVQRHRPCLGWR